MPVWLLPALLGAAMGGGMGYLRNRDPKEALLGALLGGVTGGAGSALFGGGAAASAATAAGKGALQGASQGALAQALTSQAGGKLAKQALTQALTQGATGGAAQIGTTAVTTAAQEAAKQAGGAVATNSGGGLSGIASWMRKHPMLTTAGLAAPALLGSGGKGGLPEEDPEYRDYEPAVGPRFGYAPPMKEPTDYLTYGQPGAVNEDEFQFFEPAERLKHRLGYRDGGVVIGPGGPRDDAVPAMGPGNTPIQLSNGEYVISADAVQNAGGPRAMDRLHNALKMKDGGEVPAAPPQQTAPYWPNDLSVQERMQHILNQRASTERAAAVSEPVVDRLHRAAGGVRPTQNADVWRGSPSDQPAWGATDVRLRPYARPGEFRIEAVNRGEHRLIADGEIVGVFPTRAAALRAQRDYIPLQVRDNATSSTDSYDIIRMLEMHQRGQDPHWLTNMLTRYADAPVE